MRAEITEPLQRELAEAKEDLPPVEGCGHSVQGFDALGEWKARQAGKGSDEVVYADPMPGVEEMPSWRGFVGWIEPQAEAPKKPQSQAVKTEPKAAPQSPPLAETAAAAGPDQTLDLAIPEEVAALKSSLNPEETLHLGDTDQPSPSTTDEDTLNLGNLDLSSVIEAAAASVSSPPTASSDREVNLPSSPFSPPTPVEQQTDPTLVFSLGEVEATLDDSPPAAEPEASPSEPSSPFAAPTPVELQTDPTLVVALDEPVASIDEPPLEASPSEPSSPFAPPTPVELQTDPTLVVALDEPEARIDEPPSPARSQPDRPAAPIKTGLSNKLSGVRPLAHPGRLPRGFELSADEKAVLRLCDGRRTTQAIFDGECALDGQELTDFLKRCAKVKLVTFKR